MITVLLLFYGRTWWELEATNDRGHQCGDGSGTDGQTRSPRHERESKISPQVWTGLERCGSDVGSAIFTARLLLVLGARNSRDHNRLCEHVEQAGPPCRAEESRVEPKSRVEPTVSLQRFTVTS
ncbi:hypothetical protein EVAR_88167_1 [Eumeta japonica]|uniref:Uncharacterized protein n=1 Tax=Eumeta variegata TaxID=151549 RepID=A0A4C1WBF1_EUMVA|nr:hypothetical protein EVAR_88167_1 [Eumeta japonica]